HFFFEICFKQIAATHRDTQRDHAFKRFPCGILVNGIRAIQTTTLQEHTAQRSTRSFWCNEENIHVSWWHDTSLVVERNSKAMRKIKCLTWCKMFFYSWPQCNLSCIT